ncbi:MAG: GNAT family N-acetyltransferase, partial [Candidatus Riflebacteria bacterium]|nr:GNAT family N-acetyltransferase [Candidatus Riflebacteria bacterium]
ETIEKDLDAGYCHVAEADGKIIATVSLVVEPDINYSEIFDGKWLAENKYISIHRIAVEESCKNTGAASQIISLIVASFICKTKLKDSLTKKF